MENLITIILVIPAIVVMSLAIKGIADMRNEQIRGWQLSYHYAFASTIIDPEQRREYLEKVKKSIKGDK